MIDGSRAARHADELESRLRALGDAAFNRWIAPLRRAGRADGRVRLEAPSAFHADYVERTYVDAIRAALRWADPSVESVRITAPPP